MIPAPHSEEDKAEDQDEPKAEDKPEDQEEDKAEDKAEANSAGEGIIPPELETEMTVDTMTHKEIGGTQYQIQMIVSYVVHLTTGDQIAPTE